MQVDETEFLPAAAVARRYNIHVVSLGRWAARPGLRFPSPLRIGKRRFWRKSDLTEFERRRAAFSPTHVSQAQGIRP